MESSSKIRLTFLFQLLLLSGALSTSVPMSHVRKYVGKSVEGGECAAGVQRIFRDHYGRWNLGGTATWRQGQQVLGNNNIPLGTAIASFHNARYWAHAAIYGGQNSEGIKVYDQWKGHPFSARTLRRSYYGNKPASNQASYFYVVE